MATLFTAEKFQVIGANGPIVGAQVFTYAAGTLTPLATYTDQGGLSANTNPVITGADGRASIWLGTAAYRVRVYDTVANGGALIDDVDNIVSAEALNNSIKAALANTSDPAQGDALIGVKAAFGGAIARTQHDKNADSLNIKDFGGIGTAVPANVTADTAARDAVLATGKALYLPEGDFYFSNTTALGAGAKMYGAGRGKTRVHYTGAAEAIVMGTPGPTVTLTYDPVCGGFTLLCENRATTVKGVVLRNAVYFHVYDMTIIGSGDPNSSTPANRVLYGEGLNVSDNSILGIIENVSCRVWNYGQYFWTRSDSPSNWCAAIEVRGGEVATCMYGIVIGDPTITYPTAVGVHFHDIWVQGAYTTGIKNYSGESTLFDSIYFEGNANYDYDQGGGAASPTKCMVHRCPMASEGIGTTPYGTFPYISKVRLRSGSFTSIEYNDMSVSTSIPLIITDAAADSTLIEENRLNSAAAASARIQDAGSSTITRDNFPEAPRYAAGTITKTLSDASAAFSFTTLTFRPSSIEFFGSVDGQAATFFGTAGIGDGLQQKCLATDGSTGLNYTTNDCIRLIQSTGNEQKAVLTGFLSNGFTLNWTKVGAPGAQNLLLTFIARR